MVSYFHLAVLFIPSLIAVIIGRIAILVASLFGKKAKEKTTNFYLLATQIIDAPVFSGQFRSMYTEFKKIMDYNKHHKNE